ncbi:MAG: UDP-N-acetylmuramoyl-L-alanyl-D-glutamate--2,6-diaminopimelate ligase [Ignavibacteriales bacterium]|nr:UDP-N-acetylmuramoyl-L-alanyl-D-glutamate--2,6-diaminopimelate ligase [Ignavibacteriales bacterium]
MILSQLLNGISVRKLFQTMYGKMVVTHEMMIAGIQYDSRKISRDEMFVAIRGTAVDGHKFISDAVSRGAKCVVVEDDNSFPDSLAMHTGVIKVVVENSRKALAQLSANFYDHPSKKLKLVGVTGTNGKTTATIMIQQLLSSSENKVGLLGTIKYFDGNEEREATHTTPESLELNRLLAEMVRNGCSSAVMEVSSHSLALDRVFGLDFDCAVFTNLTQDHLDFHSTIENYFGAKQILFNNLKENATAITNVDSDYGKRMVENSQSKKVTFGINSQADYQAKEISLSINGTQLTVNNTSLSSPFVGKYNVYNLLAAYSVASELNVSNLQSKIENLKPVEGRFQQISSPFGWTAIIDYAHTHDALENVLKTIREILPKENGGRVITIFGAGGDRDTTKRPKMGNVATELSDVVIVTSDNPRTENAEQIIADVAAGIKNNVECIKISNRREAIYKGLSLAKKNDVVLIAGKGHENYQIIGTTKEHFSDREEIEKYIEANS